MRSLLEPRLDAARLSDALLSVDELVTNSVRHAAVGPDRNIGIEVLVLSDRLRLCVVDPGSDDTPHIATHGREDPGGFGLAVVDHLSLSWGVARDGAGVTRTWCDLPLGSTERTALA
jgi:anti-sigma regulatory factor (Ser/Thr protein kinase)